MAGFERGRRLKKVGLKAQDTAELSFTDVHVPAANLLGEEGRGFGYLMQNLAQERLSIAVGAIAGASRALELTVDYTKDRTAFGSPVSAFQNTRFELAEMDTEVTVTQVFVDRCIRGHVEHELAAPTRPRRSGGPPTCRTAWSTAASSCTAATATCSSTRSRRPSWTPACSRSTAARTRS